MQERSSLAVLPPQLWLATGCHNPSANADPWSLPHAATLAVPFVNYGMRAQVRIIRPGRRLRLGEDYYRYGTEGPGDVDRDMKDD